MYKKLTIVFFTSLVFSFSSIYSQKLITIEQSNVTANNVFNSLKPIYANWQTATLAEIPTIFTDLSGSPFVYVYEISSDNKPHGYCAISAWDNLPVLNEATIINPPVHNSQKCRNLLSESIGVKNEIKEEFISTGFGLFYIKFTVENENYYYNLNYSDPMLFSGNEIGNNGDWGGTYGGVIGDGSSVFDLGVYSDQGHNSFYYNDPYDVYSGYSGTIYARYNWWNDPDPSPAVSNNVSWLYYLTSNPLSKGLPAAGLFEALVHKYADYFVGQRALAFLHKCYKQQKNVAAILPLLTTINQLHVNKKVAAQGYNIATTGII